LMGVVIRCHGGAVRIHPGPPSSLALQFLSFASVKDRRRLDLGEPAHALDNWILASDNSR
jgi:hypothetical protein